VGAVGEACVGGLDVAGLGVVLRSEDFFSNFVCVVFDFAELLRIEAL